MHLLSNLTSLTGRTWLLLGVLALPGAALACTPAEPTISAWGAKPPRGWTARECAPAWTAQATPYTQVGCYRVSVGKSPVRIAQDAFGGVASSALNIRQLGPGRQRVTYTAEGLGTQVLEIQDQGREGVAVNYAWPRPQAEYLRGQLRQVLVAAEQQEASDFPPAYHPWLRWLLGDGRRDCVELAPLDRRLVAGCRIEIRPLRFEDPTSAYAETRDVPLLELRLNPEAELRGHAAGKRPYAVYLADGCAQARIMNTPRDHYADHWPL